VLEGPPAALQSSPQDGERGNGGAWAARKHHATYLGMMLGVVALSFLLRDVPGAPGTEDAVVLPLPGGAHWTLPPLCPVKALTGRDCPGCGLTRSFVSLAHGDLGGSWRHHRMGVVLFVAVLYQLVYRPIMIARGEWLPPGWLAFIHRWTGRALIAGLIVNWVYNIIVRY
jgi:hypothetical protein